MGNFYREMAWSDAIVEKANKRVALQHLFLAAMDDCNPRKEAELRVLSVMIANVSTATTYRDIAAANIRAEHGDGLKSEGPHTHVSSKRICH